MHFSGGQIGVADLEVAFGFGGLTLQAVMWFEIKRMLRCISNSVPLSRDVI